MLRFSISPMGDMSIDSLRVAILTYLLAHQRKEPFGIRIDDIDKSKVTEGKDTEIMQILEKFALVHDSLFHQSEHLHMHQTLAIKLLEEEKAFVCTCEESHCTKECHIKNKTLHATLKKQKTPFVVRIKQTSSEITFDDIIQGHITIPSNQIDAFILLDTQGIPTPDFASACDDMLQNTTMIIHEENHIPHTAKQVYIRQQLGFDSQISYAHISPIVHTQNHNTVKWFLEQGFIPDAIINTLLSIDQTNLSKKIFTLPEAITSFKLKEISTLPSRLDIDTIKMINRKHLENMDDIQLSSLFGFADADVGKLVKLYLSEASTINELALKIRPIFAPKDFESVLGKEMKILQKIIADAPMLHHFETFQNHLIQTSGLKDETFFPALRHLLTGAKDGPELAHIYPYIKPYLLEIAS